MTANQPASTPTRRGRNRWYFGIALLVFAAFLAWNHFRTGRSYDEQPLQFDGGSEQLDATVVLPTLDTPIPDGKSAIWCASFQLAWNRLKDDVAKGPIQLTHNQEVADRLNSASQSASDLHPDSIYAAAGLVNDGIVDRIRTEMSRKFPRLPAPELEAPAGGAVAYAFLTASTKFTIPFFDNDEPFLFKDLAGKQTSVGSFGIRRTDDYAYEKLRAQVKALYCPQDFFWSEQEIPEFIIDPCVTSQPYQLILARVNRQANLADTLVDIEKKIATQSSDVGLSWFGPRDSLLIPNMAWKVNHHFKELEGRDKVFTNPALRGVYLDAALQTIQFRLDRSGAELASESKVYVKPSANFFEFDRPFLIMMKRRGQPNPFFVMWVENSELLQKRKTQDGRPDRVAVLNRLRDEINAQYGYLDGVPRVNRGPCGRFAKTFREQWNARFREPVNITFVIPNDGGECCHVLVRLPDGSYFDGGNGVMTQQELLALQPDSRIDQMLEFDPQLLDQRTGSLDRHYGRCPNYADDVTMTIIDKHLAQLPSDVDDR